jgi:hypothetical protein
VFYTSGLHSANNSVQSSPTNDAGNTSRIYDMKMPTEWRVRQVKDATRKQSTGNITNRFAHRRPARALDLGYGMLSASCHEGKLFIVIVKIQNDSW